jgi:hypothetical protein
MVSDLEMRQRALVWFARSYVGITEQGGANKGQMVERFQKAVDGKAQGEPWCVGFVQHCVQQVDALMDAITQQNNLTRSRLPQTELATEVWHKSPNELRRDHVADIAPGMLVVWAKLVDGKPSWQGHIGVISFVAELSGDMTVEGNTSSGVQGSQREGDGVYERTRSFFDLPGFVRLGFLDPWG